MEPIVSPWFIYAIGIADQIKDVMGWIGGLLTIAAFFGTIVIFFGCSSEMELIKKKDDRDFHPWMMPVPAIIIVLWWGLYAVIPTSKTVIGMAVASQVTSQRVVKAGKIVYAAKDDLKKDIVDIILALKDKPEEPVKKDGK